MAQPSDEDILIRLQELLTVVDLQQTSEKMLREKLEAEFGTSVTDKKGIISSEVKKFLEENGEEGGYNDEHDGEGEEGFAETALRVGSKRKNNTRDCKLSEAMQQFLGVESMSRIEVAKKIWEHIKEHDLQDPENRRNIILDDKMKTIFTEPLTILGLPGQLSNHVWPAGSKSAARESGSGASPKPKTRKASKVEASATPASGGKKKGSGFQKPIKVSSDLADFLGAEEISRPQLTKFMWDYFKNNGLQDPKDRRHILCDDKLKSLMKVDRFQAFGFMKYLKHHMES